MPVFESEAIEKLEPMARGRTDLRKRKPKQLAVIIGTCTGCAGSPACVEYCPVEACMFRVPDGMFLDGCPWNAIETVSTEEWEAQHGVELPDAPDREPSGWGLVSSEYV